MSPPRTDTLQGHWCGYKGDPANVTYGSPESNVGEASRQAALKEPRSYGAKVKNFS